MPRIHHVTAIAGDPQRNIDFYAGSLGMRLVKVTVNFGDPGSYHFYFGDELGTPGSLLTFFAWPNGGPGRQGTGQVGTVALGIRPAALGFWIERLLARGIHYEGPSARFDERVLSFKDPDGMMLELVATPRVENVTPWTDGPVPAEHAIRGVHGVTIFEDGDQGSAEFLTRHLGFVSAGEEANRFRMQAGDDGLGTIVDLRRVPGFWRGAEGVGTVHHVAYRAANDAEQLVKRDELEGAGVHVTPVRDRLYFRSIYFHEPGGVLYEIATEGPGFTVDERPADLGSQLRLPPRLESVRDTIERSLPPLRSPAIGLVST
jgi:catechol 2,3-dioxygenase-like lactoylglutathione lyase family enzyme